jgi:hypothetical protein
MNRSHRLAMVGLATLELAGIGVLIVLFVMMRRRGLPFAMLTQDAAGQAELPFFAGYVSNVGAMLWCIAASVCLFSFALIQGRDAAGWTGFFLCAGLLSALLGADDLLLLHEEVFRRAFGLREEIVFGAYMLLLLAFMTRYSGRLRQGPYFLLLLAVGFFVGSLAADLEVTRVGPPYHHLVEDGAKFMGVVNWCVFFTLMAWQRVRPMIRG